MLEALGSPLTLPSGQTLPNRLAKSALSENLGTADGAPTDGLVPLYERLGRGGAGLLITGNVIVDPNGRTETHNVVIVDDRSIPELRRWADAAKSGGARVWMQVNHAGRQTPRMVTWSPVAPSAVGLKGMGGLFSTPRALTEREVEVLIERFVRAARVAEAAGFDGVQFHGAHGYLVSQFLSPLTNRRADGYGGDVDGRMRFLLEIVERTRAVTSASFGIGVKLNSADFQRGGFTLEDSMEVARRLERAGIDLLEVSGGNYERPAMMGSKRADRSERASTRSREAFFLEYAERLRDVVSLPLMVTGGFRSAAAMEAAVRGRATDVVGLGRPLAVEPDLPRRLLDETAAAAAPHHVGVGIRLFDDMLQIHWYQAQLARMAGGSDPDPSLGRWTTLVGQLARSYLQNVKTALGPRAPSLTETPSAA